MSDSAAIPDRIGAHYRVECLLGTGGTSRVLAVIDERSGKRLALKQALNVRRDAQHARTFTLFRQEYHVLSQIAHPNVVAAFDYGFDEGIPFYTMELLHGRSIAELAPLPWQRLCPIILDLCSPLSMLHARRFVHCDVTARNVIITADGVTKLIDFGALAAIDQPSDFVAGTPPHMAPELVRRQSLDGRADMFALGALMYWALSTEHAYPARTIQELPTVWRNAPPTLQQLGVDVPPALDQLVMSLLSLHVDARPLQLAELVHRLSAIVGGSYVVDNSSVRAQVAKPRLIGRDHVLAAFREAHGRAVAGQGDMLCVAGAKGSGRTRVLEACALEAMLFGSLVIRVAAQAENNPPFGVLARIFRAAVFQDSGILAGLPAAIRGSLIDGDGEAALARTLASAPVTELETCWRALSKRRCAVIVIDDFGRADVPSIQQLLLLTAAARQLPLLLVIAIGAGESALDRDVAALLDRSHIATLAPLTHDETALLLRSLFGDATGLEHLTDWVQRASEGLPGACVELAHFALERGFLRCIDGQFQISDEVVRGSAALPRAIDDALVQRVRALPALAREALGASALITPFGPLTAAEHAQLLMQAGWSQAEALDALDQLRDAQLLRVAGDGYELASAPLARHAKAQLTAAETSAWHVRLSHAYQQRGHDFSMLAIWHLENAGEREAAYRQLIGFDERMRGPDDPNIKLGGSPTGIAFHQTMLEHARSAGSRVEQLHFQGILTSIGATSDPSLSAIGAALLPELRADVGLDLWDDLDPALDDHARLIACLTRAQERVSAAPAGERLAPIAAIGQLAQSAAALAAMYGATLDVNGAIELARQFSPLRTLAPVLALTNDMLETVSLVLQRGSCELARRRAQLEALRQKPDGLSELIWQYMLGALHYEIGRDLAVLGDEESLKHADVLAMHRRSAAEASSIRLLHALAHGWFREAARHRRERAIAALASMHENQRLPASYLRELSLLDACGDLLELQRTAAWFEARAERFPNWAPFAACARASCHVLCDRFAEAEAVIAPQLSAAPPLRHPAWYWLRALRAEVALHTGDAELAMRMAEDVLRTAAQAGIDMRPETRAERVLALARAARGDHDGALAVLTPVIERVEAEALHTVRAGQLYETRARIALARGDRAAFDADVVRTSAIYSRGAHPGLLAKLQRLGFAQQRTATGRRGARGHVPDSQLRSESVQTELEGRSRSEQCDYLLALLLRDARAIAGHLYRHDDDGQFIRVAAQQVLPSDDTLDAQVNAYAQQLTQAEHDVTRSLLLANAASSITHDAPDTGIEHYQIVSLRGTDDKLHGLALLRVDAETAFDGCTPGLCTVVGDVLARMTHARASS